MATVVVSGFVIFFLIFIINEYKKKKILSFNHSEKYLGLCLYLTLNILNFNILLVVMLFYDNFSRLPRFRQ